MTGKKLAAITVTLVANLTIFAAIAQAQSEPATGTEAPAQNAVAESQAGIAQLRMAKGYLEKAGDKWAGYRIKAIQSIDQAFKAMGVSPQSTPNEMQTGDVDEPEMMNKGVSGLQTARVELAQAGKTRAVAYIDQALQDLQKGINWARVHKAY